MKTLSKFISDTPEHVHHVTLTRNMPSIRREGLRPFKTSNWKRKGDGSRYGGGAVHAFEHEDDAVRWAAKMDWDLHKKTGSGNVSIVKVRSHGAWEPDDNDPLSQAGRKGRWLKSHKAIGPEHVLDARPVTQEMIRDYVARR